MSQDNTQFLICNNNAFSFCRLFKLTLMPIYNIHVYIFNKKLQRVKGWSHILKLHSGSPLVYLLCLNSCMLPRTITIQQPLLNFLIHLQVFLMVYMTCYRMKVMDMTTSWAWTRNSSVRPCLYCWIKVPGKR